jgi:hypothetical protein
VKCHKHPEMSATSITDSTPLRVDETPKAAKDDTIPVKETESGDDSPLSKDVNAYLSRSVHDLISLHGRTIVITGGARGLGLEAWASPSHLQSQKSEVTSQFSMHSTLPTSTSTGLRRISMSRSNCISESGYASNAIDGIVTLTRPALL